MSILLPDIRNVARAVIEQDGKVLFIKKQHQDRTWLVLPGGGQDTGEDMATAAARECYEEVAARVEVVELMAVIDHFKQRDSHPDMVRHLFECIFRCKIIGQYTPQHGTDPDDNQIDVLWVERTELTESMFRKDSVESKLFLQSQHQDSDLGSYKGRVGQPIPN